MRNEYMPTYGKALGKPAFYTENFPCVKDSFDHIRDGWDK